MESYEVLEKAIPKKMSAKVAQYLSISADYVRRWRREPDSDDAPTASGQRSILDRICDLIDIVFLINPQGSALIVNHVVNHHENLLQLHAEPITDQKGCAEHSADLLKETTEAINKLNLDGVSNETLKELIDVRDAADRTISALNKTLKGTVEKND